MESYIELLKDVIWTGERHNDRTGVGTLSTFGRQFRHDMLNGFPLLTTKQLPLRWIFEELKWFLSGSSMVRDLQKTGVDIWDEWATDEKCQEFNRGPGNMGPIYGELWRNFGGAENCLSMPQQPGCGYVGVDQIKQLLNEIETNPNSRRLIVTGWHPFQQTRVSLPPCHTMWQIKCHTNDRSMSLHLYARSIDIFLGLPFNIASYALLLEMICSVTNYVPRELIISFGDLHLYTNHIQQANAQIGRQPRDLPTLTIANMPTGENPLEKLLAIEWKDIHLDGYDPHPKIKADVAV